VTIFLLVGHSEPGRLLLANVGEEPAVVLACAARRPGTYKLVIPNPFAAFANGVRDLLLAFSGHGFSRAVSSQT
jgi:hypothetical protein